MNIIDAIILGIIQGITEFLPVSSDGHLVLLPTIFHMNVPDLTMIGVVHLGTLVAVVIYFRRDLWNIITAVLIGLRDRNPMGTTDSRLGWFIAVGCIPAVIIGFTLEDFFADVFSQPAWAAFFLLVTAGLLVLGEKLLSGDKTFDTMTWTDTIIIGLFQASALLPGLSRSGSTIFAGLQRGLDRAQAARYSFLLGVPVIFGVGMLSLFNIATDPTITADSLTVYLAAFVTATLVGYFCIYFLLSWVRNHSLYIFAVYCTLLGGGYLLYSFISG